MRATPPNITVEVGTKFVPVTVIVVGNVVPVNTSEGESFSAKPGTGLLTATVVEAEVPPPGEAFTAVRARLPVLATSAAVNATST